MMIMMMTMTAEMGQGMDQNVRVDEKWVQSVGMATYETEGIRLNPQPRTLLVKAKNPIAITHMSLI